MSYNPSILYNAINVSSVTDLLDTVSGVVGLFDGRVVPEFFTGFKTINFYLSSPFSGSQEWAEYNFSINCRAKTGAESRTIAAAVFDQLNRADFTDFHTNCDVLGTLPPIDSTDVFNTPVECILKSRT